MDDVATKVIEILKKHMKEPMDNIGPDTALTDLKIESLDLAMIVFDIEDSFGVEIPYNANEEAPDSTGGAVGGVVDGRFGEYGSFLAALAKRNGRVGLRRTGLEKRQLWKKCK
jgi:nodulation protein F